MPPTELAEAVLGSLMMAVGLASMGAAALRRPRADRAAVWFGLFSGLYGIRLAADSSLVQALFAVGPRAWDYVAPFVTYAILAPAALFARALLGPGWRRMLTLAARMLVGYAAFGVLADLVRQEPGSILWLNPPAVALLAAGCVTALHGRLREWPWPFPARVAAAGGLFFVAVASYETFLGARFGPWDFEPFAMVVFTGTLAYLIAHRALENERQLVVISSELQLAREIQQSLLPKDLPRTPSLDIAAGYLPMREVAGDFYDVTLAPSGALTVIVADVTGHGVPAALVASMVKVAFAAEADRIDDPGLVLEGINRTLAGKFERAYVTAFCGTFDPRGRSLRYAAAGHPHPVVRRASGALETLAQGGMMLALATDTSYPTAEVALAPGDRVVIVTDGVLEALDPAGRYFGDEEFASFLLADRASSAAAVIGALVGRLRRWVGSPDLQDDATIVVIAVRD